MQTDGISGLLITSAPTARHQSGEKEEVATGEKRQAITKATSNQRISYEQLFLMHTSQWELANRRRRKSMQHSENGTNLSPEPALQLPLT
ncbi:hypothetical protein LIER_33650 [Lithospermum erythrorhizon]|uniref:Uncharacterized protein n=1 Tax=Lithospermum erythrorhizon TaxID=34254 RepID=A0AAV3S1A5_LITER